MDIVPSPEQHRRSPNDAHLKSYRTDRTEAIGVVAAAILIYFVNWMPLWIQVIFAIAALVSFLAALQSWILLKRRQLKRAELGLDN